MERFNINQLVRVKLTDAGKKIYYHQYDEINKNWGREVLKPKEAKLDKEGYLRDSLWSIMSIFGEHIGLGSCLPFETEIFLEDKI